MDVHGSGPANIHSAAGRSARCDARTHAAETVTGCVESHDSRADRPLQRAGSLTVAAGLPDASELRWWDEAPGG